MEQFLILIFVLLKFSEVPGLPPPFFLNPAYAIDSKSIERYLIFFFFCSRSKKACFFQVERLLKKFCNAVKQEKSLYSGEEIRK